MGPFRRKCVVSLKHRPLYRLVEAHGTHVGPRAGLVVGEEETNLF